MALSLMTAECLSLGGGGPLGGQRKSAAGANNFFSFSVHMGLSLKETRSEETSPRDLPASCFCPCYWLSALWLKVGLHVPIEK